MMSSIRRGLLRLWSFFRKRPLDDDLQEEMAAHIELAIEEKMRSGISRQEARRQAMIRFGGVMQAQETQRESRGLPGLDVLMQDLTFSIRTLRRDSSFTIIAVLILALGIGANIAVFSVVNAMLVRPLPFRDPQQLVWMGPAPSKCGFSCETYTLDAFDEFREQNHAFQDVAGYFAFSSSDNSKLTGYGQPKPLTGIMVTQNFFQTLGVEPAMGRHFRLEEAVKGARPVVLLANPYWRTQFNSDPNIVGKAIDLDNTPTTVVGVLPDNFDFGSVFAPGSKVDYFSPLVQESRDWGNILALVGRMKPGVSIAQAQADSNTVLPHLYFSVKYPQSLGSYKDTPMRLVELKEYVSGKLRGSLILLWWAVGIILLIVCVNLANLMLARAATRGKEFALRSALGAGRIRLIRQLLTESLVLSGAGSLLGLGFAYGITSFMANQGSLALPMLSTVRIDGVALGWTVLIAIAAALLFGIAPGLRAASKNVQEALKDSGQGMSRGRNHQFTRALLVIVEVAMACMLLVSAGLLLRSFLRVLDVDLGFQPSHAASVAVDYDGSIKPEARGVLFREIIRQVSMIPGVEAAGMVDYLPLERNRSWGSPTIKGKSYKPGELPGAFVYVVTPGYFHSIGMVLRGRDFTWDDGPKSENVIVLNETAARSLFSGGDAVGQMVVMSGTDMRVIGVIKDVHEANVEGQPGWQAYFSVMQQGPAGAQLVVRTKLPPTALADGVMAKLRQINPGQPAAEFRTIQQIVDHAVSPRRFFVMLVVSFAVFGVVLAALGIYGVISYSVTQRTQEIGIRMALGATISRVQMSVIGQTFRLAVIGIVAGTVCSYFIGKGIAALLFGTPPTDLATFAGMISLLAVVALFAGYLPARRASRIDPMSALRNN
jgi:predicted permease